MEASEFEKDIHLGLSSPFKHISSKYFYDDIGSGIFQEIMKMPEYYPTNCEFEILSLQGAKIIEKVDFKAPFNIVEFGAGDGIKTRQLLKTLVETGVDFTYVPIDISGKAIVELKANMESALPQLRIQPITGNYFEPIRKLADLKRPCLFLFLGGNIGNYSDAEADHLLRQFSAHMKSGDKLLTGFDLQKHPGLIREAYDDKGGVTKAFNLNLLRRVNRELGGNFRLDQFDFYSYYNPVQGEVRSYLVSLAAQTVHLKTTDKCYDFAQNELIWTELSKKYTSDGIRDLCNRNNFTFLENFMDCKHYFTDSLWIK